MEYDRRYSFLCNYLKSMIITYIIFHCLHVTLLGAYFDSYPHEKYTLGFAGRGGGNAFYINTENNTMTHGPGTDRGGKL